MNIKNIKDIRIEEYNYELPDSRIAKYPLTQRDSSKLLCYSGDNITEDMFSSLPSHLPQGAMMVFNNTKVIHARLLFRKETGSQIEIFCLNPISPADYQVNFQQNEKCSWSCMIGNAKRWKSDPLHMTLESNEIKFTLTASKKESNNGEYIVEFEWNNPLLSFSEVLELAGNLPIPPYLNRDAEEDDDETYQTVYSKIEGSVAAPTAGLHFTDEVMSRIREREISLQEVTLHVGAGTFRPVKAERIEHHDMHTEFITVSRKVIENIYNNKSPLIVVGTTSVRTIESLYYIGKKLGENSNLAEEELTVTQWEPYTDIDKRINAKEALKNILDYLDREEKSSLMASTQIMIAPGYIFNYVDAVVTNFHQPQSTLLLLVSALVGDKWKEIYNYAMNHDFRFLSYGDSSLLWRK